jgi:hypothetical protein
MEVVERGNKCEKDTPLSIQWLAMATTFFLIWLIKAAPNQVLAGAHL